MLPSRVPLIVTCLLLFLALALVCFLFFDPPAHQWDFRAYYCSAKVFLQAGNPYDMVQVSAVTQEPVILPLVYPPIANHFFGLFTHLSLPVARHVWLSLKLAALLTLFVLWHRHFLPLKLDPPTALFFLFAFNSAIFLDLDSGNPALFEQLLIWHGFSRLIRGSPWPLCAYLILVSQVKATSICLSVVFLLAAQRPLWLPFVVSWAGTLGVFLLNPLLYPHLMPSFLSRVLAVDERGIINPSSLAACRDAAGLLRFSGLPLLSWSDFVLYACFVTWVVLISLDTYLDWRRRGYNVDSRLVVLATCVVYALTMPRFKDYTYVLLLIPGLYALRTFSHQLRVPIAAVFIFFPYPREALPFASSVVYPFLLAYTPVIATGCLWRMYLDEFHSSSASTPSSRSSS